MFSYLLDTEFLHTKAIIIIGVGFYLAITVVIKLCGIWTSTDASNLICLHAVSSANLMDSPYGLWLLRNVTMHGLLLRLWYVYYGIVEFSVRDKQ